MNDYEYMSRDTLLSELVKAQKQVGELEQAVKHWEDKANEQLAKRVDLEAKHEQTMADWAKSDMVKALHVGSLEAKLEAVQAFIQASIDREDWTPEELSEIFWEELAEILDLNLNLFEEKTVLLTITQSITVKVKKGYDLSGYDFDINFGVDTLSDEVEIEDYESPEVTDWEEM